MAQKERPPVRLTSTPETRTRNLRKGRSPEADRPWGRSDFFSDLRRASRRLTDEINADPDEAARLDEARAQSRAGKLKTRAELDAALEEEDER
jgi:hypothetical protein